MKASNQIVNKPRKRALKTFLATLLVLAVGIAVGWASSLVFMPKPAVEKASSTVVVVEPGVIESSFAVNARVTWPRSLIAVNSAIGTVTKAPRQSSKPTKSGEVLYEIDLNPVVALEGEVPAFRDMHADLEGADVAQLQEFLVQQELLEYYEPGNWQYSTTIAVREWQEATGQTVDGVVNIGEVVFVQGLPARIAIDNETVRLGAVLSGGEEVLFGLGDSPTFMLPITDAQVPLLPIGSRVEVAAPDGTIWQAEIVEQLTSNEMTGVDLLLGPLSSSGAATICGEDCDQVAVDPEGTLLRTKVVIIDEVEGLVVASAALTTNASGQAILIDEEGTHHPVEVIAGAKGMTAITGVPEGMKVIAPAEAP